MVKQLGKGKARSPTKKEKLSRLQDIQESERLAQYIYKGGIGLIIGSFIALYLYLAYKARV